MFQKSSEISFRGPVMTLINNCGDTLFCPDHDQRIGLTPVDISGVDKDALCVHLMLSAADRCTPLLDFHNKMPLEDIVRKMYVHYKVHNVFVPRSVMDVSVGWVTIRGVSDHLLDRHNYTFNAPSVPDTSYIIGSLNCNNFVYHRYSDNEYGFAVLNPHEIFKCFWRRPRV